MKRPGVRAAIAFLVVLGLFVAAIVLWDGSSDDGITAQDTPPASATASTPATTGTTPTGSVTGSAVSSVSPDEATLPPLPGGRSAPGTNSTELRTFGPGQHRVEIRVTSDSRMLSVAYSIKGDSTARSYNNVRSPVVVTRTLAGNAPYAAVSLQISPTATRGSCRIVIDGKVAVQRSTAMPYGVTACVA